MANQSNITLFLSVHPDGVEGSWWRGCKALENQTLGCSEHEWLHDGTEMLVHECVCDKNLCNQDTPGTTSTVKTTTMKGYIIE